MVTHGAGNSGCRIVWHCRKGLSQIHGWGAMCSDPDPMDSRCLIFKMFLNICSISITIYENYCLISSHLVPTSCDHWKCTSVMLRSSLMPAFCRSLRSKPSSSGGSKRSTWKSMSKERLCLQQPCSQCLVLSCLLIILYVIAAIPFQCFSCHFISCNIYPSQSIDFQLQRLNHSEPLK